MMRRSFAPCTMATAASGCLLDRDFHSFAGKHRVGEPFPTQFFDALKKLVVVFGVVMREGQALHAGHFRKLHGLIEAAVSPSAPFLQFLSRVLRVMDQQVRAARQLHQPRIDLLAMLDIRANAESDDSKLLFPEAELDSIGLTKLLCKMRHSFGLVTELATDLIARSETPRV